MNSLALNENIHIGAQLKKSSKLLKIAKKMLIFVRKLIKNKTYKQG